jgi:pimeloyl-ACP methyl ester carboxylesterase
MNTTINNLSVFTEGNEEDKPIVFVHGFPFDHHMWDAQVNVFKDKYFCVSYDIRGLGISPHGDGQHTMEMFVDDLEKIINELRLENTILCGLSMGGYISLRAMERIQDKFSAVILCDTKSVADDNETRLKRAEGIKEINAKRFEQFIENFIANCFSEEFINNQKEKFQKVVNRSKKNSPVGVKGCLLAMASRTDTTKSLAEIIIPALIICGSEDKLSPPELMKSMADNIPNTEFILVGGAGHMAPIENPIVVNKAIEMFLQEL